MSFEEIAYRLSQAPSSTDSFKVFYKSAYPNGVNASIVRGFGTTIIF